MKEFIVPKVDFDKTDSENKVVRNLQILSFETLEIVMQFSKEGFIEKSVLETYFSIKKEYNFVISSKITFFDIDEAEELLPITYGDLLSERYKSLIDNIKNAIEKIKSEV
ncbi:hypothetical protein IMSAGC017_00295 [Thomasclavelia cocleata]|uniref:Uncharacterized protein n=1 Tax=Thomasclavelia cocleata TaxID=69824 RepID=A0A829Z790_9FIRM|nr:hypothetical protein [Thomasclavelia cocleata]GFI40263.1 hypothetical protein IMSAGC017_00295 [Thomasclavelia cocleata]